MSEKNTAKPIYNVTENDSGQRLDNYLIKQCKQLNKSVCYKLIRKGQIRINGKRVKPLQKLNVGDQVRVPPYIFFVEKDEIIVPDAVLKNLLNQIIYEDDDYLVLNKPAGLPCHTGTGHKFGVVEIITSTPQYSAVQLAHRLDKDTSGCLLLAKNRAALLVFQAALKNLEVKKSYVAVLTGQLLESVVVDQPLDTENRVDGKRHVITSVTGKSAVTKFKPIKAVGQLTWVECQIDYGRTHQIRVHAKHLGMPVKGDRIYGVALESSATSLFLHAEKLSFAEFEVAAPVPSSFEMN